MMFQSWFRPFVSLNTAGKACTLKFSTFSYPSLRKGSIRNISTHSSEVFRSTAIVRSHHNPSVTTQCNLKINPTVHSIFDQNTFTWTYIVYAENHDDRRCAIIDSVLDFDVHSGKTNTTSADRIVDFIQEKKLEVQWILETHIHADHLTASAYLKGKCGGKTGISKHIIEVLNTWVPIFQTSDDTPVDGSQFDKLFDDDETFTVGPFSSQIIHTPGHTPADITYIIEDAMFVGDTMFLPDVGTGRCDFPSGAARQSFASCRRLLQWPEEYRIYVGHDYPPNSARLPHCLSTVGEQKKLNLRVQEGITEEEYVTKRDADDQSRPVPKLLFPAVQVNLRGGKFGKSTGGVQYVKIPINQI